MSTTTPAAAVNDEEQQQQITHLQQELVKSKAVIAGLSYALEAATPPREAPMRALRSRSDPDDKAIFREIVRLITEAAGECWPLDEDPDKMADVRAALESGTETFSQFCDRITDLDLVDSESGKWLRFVNAGYPAIYDVYVLQRCYDRR